MLVHDALGSRISTVNPEKILNPSILRRLEKDLEFREKISCIFLILDDYRSAYDDVVGARGDEETLISVLIQRKKISNWKVKLLEALSIVQNNGVIRKLGQNPTVVQTFYVSRVAGVPAVACNSSAKIVYKFFENLSKKDVDVILQRVYRSDVPPFELPPKYNLLELHFLWWLKHSWISISSTGTWRLRKALKIFKELGLSRIDSYDALASLDESDSGRIGGYDDAKGDDHILRNEDRSLTEARETAIDQLDEYKVEKGYLLVINQREFSRSREWRTRDGTDIDKDRLVRTFSDIFGFECETFDNLTKDQLFEQLDKFDERMAKKYDCIALALLSHGTYGNVISSDGMKCSVHQIQKKFCSHAFRGKPKILIIQACQPYEGLESDAPIRPLAEVEVDERDESERWRDLLVFNSTIPGKLSIRDSKDGTWYIQTLCNVLETIGQQATCDFLHCVTYLNMECSKLTGRIDGKRVSQVPDASYRLRKKLIIKSKRYQDCLKK